MTAAKAPAHLRRATAAWWQRVVKEHALAESDQRLLSLAGEAWDRAQGARETLEKTGLYYQDRFDSPRAHPAVAVERDSHIAFGRLLRQLALGADPVLPAGRFADAFVDGGRRRGR